MPFSGSQGLLEQHNSRGASSCSELGTAGVHPMEPTGTHLRVLEICWKALSGSVCYQKPNQTAAAVNKASERKHW